MSDHTRSGGTLSRGGHLIDLEREPEVFTAIVPDHTRLTTLQSLSGVRRVKRISGPIFKAYVQAVSRDSVMENFRLSGVCHHAYKPYGATSTRYYLSDQILVRFRSDISQEVVDSISDNVGLHLVQTLSGPNQIFVFRVMDRAGKNPIKVSNELALHKEVEYAEPDLVNRFQRAYQPGDPGFQFQWYLRSWDGEQVLAAADIDAADAWDISSGSRDVVIAVIDDGFELSHPDFAGGGKIAHPLDFVQGDDEPSPALRLGDYHGTPCAGVALAEENGLGVVGVAPGCAFMPVRVSFQQLDSEWWNIFHQTGQKAHVISCSWGPPPVWSPLPQSLKDKLHELAVSGSPSGNGCVIVFAAHNYNAPLNDPHNTFFEWRGPDDMLGQYRATQEPILNGFASHPDVIAVSASTSLNRKAAYSNWGKEISVCAPSSNGHPLDPEMMLPGLGIWTTDNELESPGFKPGSQFTDNFGGTSSAAPVVAGVAGLVRSANHHLRASEVRDIIQDTADKITDLAPDLVLGFRMGTYDDNGHSDWFGYGKVNAKRAIQKAFSLLDLQNDQFRGSPREQYARVYVLLPQNAGIEWIQAVLSSGEWFRSRWTVGFSADDAGIGDLDRRVVVAVNPGNWGGSLSEWYKENYLGVKYLPVHASTPTELTNVLATTVSLHIASLLAEGVEDQIENRGAPREQYERMYLLMSPNSRMADLQAVIDSGVLTKYRWTVGFSADDAGIGDLNDRAVISANPDAWGADMGSWFSGNYSGVLYDQVRVTTPGQLREFLASR